MPTPATHFSLYMTMQNFKQKIKCKLLEGDKMRKLNLLTTNIKDWAVERNLHTADPAKQILKLGEEFGELCQAIAKDRKKAAVKDAIGDMYVVLTILSMQLDIEIEECIELAYDEIRDRKGKMVNGVFVKEADL